MTCSHVILQLLTIFFAIALAWLNSVPVNHFKQLSWMKDWENREFHQANGLVKCFWAITVTVLLYDSNWLSWDAVIFCIILFLWQWIIFDPALNKWTNMDWDYLGKSAWFDRTFKNGRRKAIVCLVIIILLNIALWITR